jgi:hypothetical protein
MNELLRDGQFDRARFGLVASVTQFRRRCSALDPRSIRLINPGIFIASVA